jgi:N-hydroxyarylamine O-acetyltransferase
VPFENLSIHLGERVQLDDSGLLAKLVDRRRGGFCYELNGGFALLLRSLGFRVTVLAARVFGPDGALGPPFDHLALRVELDEPWLADVGFGRHSHYPLRIDAPGPQVDAGGEFEFRSALDGDVDVLKDGQPQYRLEMRARTLDEFAPTCWWQQTSPDSHFTKSLVCSMLTEHGRVTLSDRLLIETNDGERSEHTLADDAEVFATYRDRFGFDLDRLPTPPVPP